MARTAQLLRHDAYCPIKAEIRAVDSQSDLNIIQIKLLLLLLLLLLSSCGISVVLNY